MSVLELFWMIAFFIMCVINIWVNEKWYRDCLELNDNWHRLCQKIIEEAYKRKETE